MPGKRITPKGGDKQSLVTFGNESEACPLGIGGEKEMELVLWIILGAVAGWLASVIMGTSSRQGLLGDIVLGVVGAITGGFVMSFLGQPGITGFDLWSLFVAVLGAIVLISVGRLVTR